MATSVIRNYTDTTTGVTTHGITIPSVNPGVDFRLAEQKGNTVIITNTTSPIGYPETVKFSSETINDLYSGTTVDKALYAASRKGRGVMVSLHDVYKVVSDSDDSFELALPFQASLAFKFLQNSLVTETMIVEVISRLVAFLYEKDSATMNSRIQALIRGSLKPNDL
jgi:hypothetical protein